MDRNIITNEQNQHFYPTKKLVLAQMLKQIEILKRARTATLIKLILLHTRAPLTDRLTISQEPVWSTHLECSLL